MTDSLVVGIVSKRKLIRKAFIYLLLSLSLSCKLGIAAEADNLENVAEALSAANLDVLLLDVEGVDDPLKCVRRVRELSPATKPLLLTDNADETFAVQAVRSGAWGLVTKQVEPVVLGLAIEKVADGEMWFSHGTVSMALQAFSNRGERTKSPLARLTSREMEVLFLLSKGCQNKEIASRLNLSVNTVRRYTETIYRKLGVNSRLEAVICYHRDSAHPISEKEKPVEVPSFSQDFDKI